MDWLTENLNTIKDILWIIFTFSATLIAVLTYRRARHTLLQPLKTEVIKRQTSILVKLLDFLAKNNINTLIDYYGIIECNTFSITNNCGFKWEDERIQKVLNGSISFTYMNDNMKKEIKVPLSFDDAFNYGLKKRDLIKGMIENSNETDNKKSAPVFLYFTRKYSSFEKELNKYIVNPFMPKDIQNLLIKLQSDVKYNLYNPLKQVLLNYHYTLCKQEHIQDKYEISCSPLYNQFNRIHKSHDSNIISLRNLIREYLMIDKKW